MRATRDKGRGAFRGTLKERTMHVSESAHLPTIEYKSCFQLAYSIAGKCADLDVALEKELQGSDKRGWLLLVSGLNRDIPLANQNVTFTH